MTQPTGNPSFCGDRHKFPQLLLSRAKDAESAPSPSMCSSHARSAFLQATNVHQASFFVTQTCDMQEGSIRRHREGRMQEMQFGAGPEDQLFMVSDGLLVFINKE